MTYETHDGRGQGAVPLGEGWCLHGCGNADATTPAATMLPLTVSVMGSRNDDGGRERRALPMRAASSTSTGSASSSGSSGGGGSGGRRRTARRTPRRAVRSAVDYSPLYRSLSAGATRGRRVARSPVEAAVARAIGTDDDDGNYRFYKGEQLANRWVMAVQSWLDPCRMTLRMRMASTGTLCSRCSAKVPLDRWSAPEMY